MTDTITPEEVAELEADYQAAFKRYFGPAEPTDAMSFFSDRSAYQRARENLEEKAVRMARLIATQAAEIEGLKAKIERYQTAIDAWEAREDCFSRDATTQRQGIYWTSKANEFLVAARAALEQEGG